MSRALAAALASGILLAGCSQPGEEAETPAQEQAGVADEHYYPSNAEGDDVARPWLLILPGGGGIDVFGDDHFYFDVAKRWQDAGFDTMVVHYQAASPLLPASQLDNPGQMEAAVVADALASAGREGWLDLQCPGFVMGFSFGGAGTLNLAANPQANFIGAIGYYPATMAQGDSYMAKVPVLVLEGEEDQLATPEALDKFLATVTNPDMIQVHRYPGAHHGFDIPSLVEGVEYNGGKFLYQEEAAKAANAQEAAFRDAVLAANPGPSECKIEQEG